MAQGVYTGSVRANRKLRFHADSDDVVPKSSWGKCTATKLLIQSRVPRSPFLDSFRVADYPGVLIFNSRLLYGCDDADARSSTSFERAC